jgi:hypothetical protein
VQRFKKDRIGLKECRKRKYWYNPKQTGRCIHEVWNKEEDTEREGKNTILSCL